ncbi:universal stress protein [Mucilaginibacter sp. HC2]|uniref:universal stress protein n=1 Tax=Mucilaginibacter inviolabilis TaxID=2714892 RepID=UPI00140E3A6D|nr:universal stress protein [Mucilaginibacter inviolabilis]NHA02570.1 universal stress protein [Mucilaginibacter inviolabilis]
MKKIAVLTDFSERAYHAAKYALSLAAKLHANIVLYHSFRVPSAQPLASQIAWPLEDYSEIKKDCQSALEKLKTQLEETQAGLARGFRPQIECRAEEEQFDLIAEGALWDRDIVLVVIGNHHQGFSSLMLGNHSREVLNHSVMPVLVVPENASFEPFLRIAFATDLGRGDLDIVQSLSGLAGHFNAELLLTHLCESTPKNNLEVQDFLQEVTNKISYPHIYYRQLEEKHIRRGLHHMAETVKANLIVMVHRQKDFVEGLCLYHIKLDYRVAH